MNRTQCVILFIIIFILIIIGYLYLYHRKKNIVLAVLFASISSVLLIASIWFLMPFSNRAEIVNIETSNMIIDTSGPNNYIICDDKTKYRMNFTNTMSTSGFDLYANNERYFNEKVTTKYRYNYKLWGIIPAYSESESIAIYVNNEIFYDLYGCSIGKPVITKE